MPAVNHVPSSNTVIVDCGPLQIQLRHAKDRWGHGIGWNSGGAFRQFLCSVEGGPDDAWPASPALQEMHVEDRIEGTVVFLAGMAGSSHWSVGLTCEPARQRLTFDVACRCKKPPVWLGSVYQLSDGVSWQPVAGSAELVLADAGRNLFVASADHLGSIPQAAIQPELSVLRPMPGTVPAGVNSLLIAPLNLTMGTVRWRYTCEAK